MKTFKRMALVAVVSLGVFGATAGAASAALSGGNFTGAAGPTSLTVNGGGPTITCNTSNITGVANDASAPYVATNVDLVFSSCSDSSTGYPASVSCTSNNSLVVDTIYGTGHADGTLDLTANACTITVTFFVSCTIRVPSAATSIYGELTNAVDEAGTDTGAANLNVPITGNTDALPFTASGSLCGTIGVPSSGTSTFQDSAGGDVNYVETGGGLDLHIS